MRGDAPRARMWAIALTLLLAPAAAAQQRPAVAPPSGHLERAQAEFQAGRYTGALEEARRAAGPGPTAVGTPSPPPGAAEGLRAVHAGPAVFPPALSVPPRQARGD